MLLSKNCVERNYSLISLVLAMMKLVNMSCKVLFMIKCESTDVFICSVLKVSFRVGGCPFGIQLVNASR